jgi:hypothetical protein
MHSEKMEAGTRQKSGVTLGKQTASPQRTGMTCVQINHARLTARGLFIEYHKAILNWF